METVANKNIKAVIDEINSLNVLTQRVKKRREDYLSVKPRLCAERSRIVTDSWKETEGEPLNIRRAKLFKSILEKIPVSIKPGELLVGSQSQYIRGASPAVDFTPYGILGILELKKLTTRGEVEESEVSDEDRASLKEDAEFWKGRSPADSVKRAWQRDGSETILKTLMGSRVITGMGDVAPGTARTIDLVKLINQGLNSVIERTKQERSKLTFKENSNSDYRKETFLNAVIISCEAVIAFAGRYSKLASELADKETDSNRKTELRKIAEMLTRVPANPAQTFHEALQSIWITFIALNLEMANAGESLGRLDQYLFPFYSKDITEGRMTRQDVAELLGCLWVKLNEVETVVGGDAQKFWGAANFQDLTLCGATRGKRDATNELSYLVLEVIRQIKLPQPAVYIRFNNYISEDFLVKAVETARDHGAGNPSFLGDEMMIRNMLQKGVHLDDALEWVAEGCAGNMPNHHFYIKMAGYMSGAKMFELALNNGIDPKTGKQVGLKTGNPEDFISFEEVYDAYKKQFKWVVELNHKAGIKGVHAKAECYRLPFTSALVEDCIERGLDIHEGGVRNLYSCYHLQDRGMVDVADSLTAIKKLVFEDKKLTMKQLLEAMKADFEGDRHAEIRKILLAVPKYGNDDDYADNMVNDISAWQSKFITSLTGPFDVPVRSMRTGATLHYYFGESVGALPNGRKAYQPLADGALSPMRGEDIKGPTAVIKSATKRQHMEDTDTLLFNMKISPMTLKSQAGAQAFIALIKTFFNRGGNHIQFNMMDQKVLIEAKKNPEQHRDLMVRVAGYSAYFVDLSSIVQDEIIARSVHEV
jgi:pyruvate formate-lyase/glycerol dehydratase family glycyl radical enzyme